MDEMRKLVDRLNETAYQYYVLDEPTISDKEWDALYDRLVQLEKETGERLPDSPTRRVGGEPLTAFEPHTHLARLWSMDKAQSVDALREWHDRAQRLRAEANAGGANLPELAFVVEQLRRIKPQVVVGHDINGEYGHGMHMVYTDCLIKALDIAPDASRFKTLAHKYGTWDVPKTYLHLYEENEIRMDYDQPLTAFDGMTAFEVSQKLGYPCHKSQQYTWFTRWINGSNNEITKATQIKTYSPCDFGLYRSTVGSDEAKNDFLENLTLYADQLPPEPPTEPPTEPPVEVPAGPTTTPDTTPPTDPPTEAPTTTPTEAPTPLPPRPVPTLPFLLLGILVVLLVVTLSLLSKRRR